MEGKQKTKHSKMKLLYNSSPSFKSIYDQYPQFLKNRRVETQIHCLNG